MDSAFIPYDNSAKNYPYNYEYAVFFDLYKKVDWNETDLLGSVSWKFFEKIGLSGQSFFEHIEKNPGMDVYFINPFPELSIYKNGWEQGNHYHAYLTELTEILLEVVGLPVAFLKIPTPPHLNAYCNFWIGNKNFWDTYMEFLKPIWNYIQTQDNSLTRALERETNALISGPYLPFIFERLFSSFLVLNPQIKALGLDYDYNKIQEYSYFPNVSQVIRESNKLESHSLIKWKDVILWKTYLFVRRFKYHTMSLWMMKLKGIQKENGLTKKEIEALRAQFILHKE